MYITLKAVEKYTMISFQNVHTYVIIQKLEMEQVDKTIISPMISSYLSSIDGSFLTLKKHPCPSDYVLTVTRFEQNTRR